MASNISTCPKFPVFPRKLAYAYGGLGYKNGPIICGGTDENNKVRRDCSKYSNGDWISADNFLENFYEWGSFTFNPDVMGNGRIVISGGSSGQV